MVLNPLKQFLYGILEKAGVLIMEKSRFRDNKNNKFENIPGSIHGDYNFKTIYLSLWLF
jgi:hypothetical protein